MSTYTTTQVIFYGEHSLTELTKRLQKTGITFGLAKRTDSQRTVKKELPHAFAKFNTAAPCANDPVWDEGAMDIKQDTRPSLSELRTLQYQSEDSTETVDC